MRIAATVLVVLYALLNVVLAVSGVLTERQEPLAHKLIPTLTFVTAAALLGVGALSRNPWLVLAGLLAGSAAPVLYGHLVEHSNVLLHHAVRALVALGIGLAFWFGAAQH